MKFSERLFRFPIRVYDTISVKRVLKKEKDDDNDEFEVPAWVKGYAKIPYSALNDLYYSDAFSIGRKPRDVAKEGFDMTTIYHKDFGDFECTWAVDKFEQELDLFAEKCEAFYEEQLKKIEQDQAE